MIPNDGKYLICFWILSLWFLCVKRSFPILEIWYMFCYNYFIKFNYNLNSAFILNYFPNNFFLFFLFWYVKISVIRSRVIGQIGLAEHPATSPPIWVPSLSVSFFQSLLLWAVPWFVLFDWPMIKLKIIDKHMSELLYVWIKLIFSMRPMFISFSVVLFLFMILDNLYFCIFFPMMYELENNIVWPLLLSEAFVFL